MLIAMVSTKLSTKRDRISNLIGDKSKRFAMKKMKMRKTMRRMKTKMMMLNTLILRMMISRERMRMTVMKKKVLSRLTHHLKKFKQPVTMNYDLGFPA